MKSWWPLTAAILSVIVVWQLLGLAECSRPESWTPARILTEKEAFHEICLMDFTKLSYYPWVAETCNNWSPDENVNSTACCNALLSGMGMAEAQLLKETGIFRLPAVSIVDSCLQNLQTQLVSQGLKHKAVETCFPETLRPRFVTNNSLCLGIETSDDFEEIVGTDNIMSLQRACAVDLTDPPACSNCLYEMLGVYNVFNKLPKNLTQLRSAYKSLTQNITLGTDLDARFLSDCFFDVILYTAAKATSSGAWSESTAVCIMAVQLTEEDRPFLTGMVLIGLTSSVCSTLLGCVVFSIWWSRRKRAEAHKEIVDRNQKMLKSAERPNIGPIKYNYRDIQAATNNFSPENLIGQGGFGTVYKGLMKDGREVAVKRINDVIQDGDADFLNEVEIISRIRHRNLVILRGCCVASNAEDGHQRLLVYNYIPNGSLDKMLYGQSEEAFLTWANRVKIIAGVAKGLAHLHNDTQPSIVHTDIKPANILLDEDLNARVADFGLARLSDGPESQYPVTGRQGRTPGYVAPEYALYGQHTEKSDVYSFGVMMLELLTGRKALDPSQESTPNYPVSEWAASMVQAGKVWEVVDERIRFVGPKEKMQTYVMIGCMCTKKMVTLRPTFREVLKYLQGELPLPSMSLPMQHFRLGSYDWPDVDSLAPSRRHSSPDAADLYVLTELLR